MGKFKQASSGGRCAGMSRTVIVVALAAVAAAIGGLVLLGGSPQGALGDSGAPSPSARRVSVQRKNLTISVVAAGSLQAKRSAMVSNETGKSLRIVYIAENGVLVKEGDLLIELETTALEDSITRQEIDVENLRDQVTAADTSLVLTAKRNEVDLLTAANSRIIADINKQKYEEGDYAKDKMDAEARVQDLTSKVRLAEEDLSQAEIDLDWTEKLFARGFEAQRNLTRDRQAVNRQEVNFEKTKLDLKSAEMQLGLLERYDYLRKSTQLETQVAQVESNLKRQQLYTTRDLNRLQSRLDRSRSEFARKEEILETSRERLTLTKIYALTGGMVVHLQRGGGGYGGYGNRGSQVELLEIGTTVSPRQRLIDLPDFSDWIVVGTVKESLILKIRKGQRVFVTLDALSDIAPLMGTVWEVATLPDQGNWMQNVLQYTVKIDLDDALEDFKPSMSAQIEIIVEEYENRLLVPIQAVDIDAEGGTMVWVSGETGPRLQEVQVGKNNEQFVEIVTGLSEGEVVFVRQVSGGRGANASGPAERANPAQRREAGEAAREAARAATVSKNAGG